MKKSSKQREINSPPMALKPLPQAALIEERLQVLVKVLPFWIKLTPGRQEVFLNMAYNLGMPKFLRFRDPLAAAAVGDIEAVCREMKDSLWYHEVGDRADRLID